MIEKLKPLIKSSTSKDSFVSLIGNVGVAGLGMLFTIIIARALRPSDFGVFSALLALGTLLVSLGDLGISSALINFMPEFKKNRHHLISLTFFVQLAAAVILLLIVLFLSVFRESIIPGTVFIDYLAISVFVFVSVFSQFGQSILKAERKFTQNAIAQWIETGLKTLIILPVFYLFSVSILVSIMATLSSVLAAAIYALNTELKNISFLFPKHHLKKVFEFTKWIALMRIFSVAISRVDVILLSSLSDNYQAGLFAAAARIALLFVLIVSTLGSVVAPRFSSFQKKEQTISYLKKLFLLILSIGVIMAISILFAPFIVKFVFGNEYLEAIPVFRALTLSMIPFLFSIVTTNPLIYTFNKPNIVAVATIIQVITLVILDVIFIPIYGAIGPTIALAISNFLVLGITGFKLNQLLRK